MVGRVPAVGVVEVVRAAPGFGVLTTSAQAGTLQRVTTPPATKHMFVVCVVVPIGQRGVVRMATTLSNNSSNTSNNSNNTTSNRVGRSNNLSNNTTPQTLSTKASTRGGVKDRLTGFLQPGGVRCIWIHIEPGTGLF